MKTTFTLTKSLALFLLTFLLFGVTTNAQTFRVFDPLTQSPAGGVAGAAANFATGVPTATGLKFRVTQAGTADAIHFYQGNSNTGPHVVNLWDLSGTNLSTATLPADGVRGWRTVTLPSPVTLNTITTYVISVHSTSGFVSRTGATWPATDYTGSPAFVVIGTGTSVADPANPGNGVNATGVASNVMPTSTADVGANYWVDLSFTTFNPLPVTLSDFNSSVAGTNVTLTWKTSYEANNKGFALERSNNGRDWYEVSFINGAGQSIDTKNYSYVDKSLAPGAYQYRLRQIDFDNKFKTSSIVVAQIDGRGKVGLAMQGLNPFSGTTKMRYDLPSAQRVRLSLLDVNGREVKVLVNGTKETGSHIQPIDVNGLRPQVFIVRLQTEEGTVTEKIISQ